MRIFLLCALVLLAACVDVDINTTDGDTPGTPEATEDEMKMDDDMDEEEEEEEMDDDTEAEAEEEKMDDEGMTDEEDTADTAEGSEDAGVETDTDADSATEDTEGDTGTEETEEDAGEPEAAGGRYIDATADASVATAALADGSSKVLFFHASWCGKCALQNEKLSAWYGAGAVPLTTYMVDYDTADDLKAKYGVSTQDTFVLIDGEGNAVQTETGPGEAALKGMLGLS